MRREDIDWQSGKVVFWELSSLDLARPLTEQLDELKEDLAQIEYPGERVLDIGWYPSFSEEGQFVVRVVATSDWDTPLYLHSTSDAKELTDCLPRAVAAAVAS